MSSTAKTEPSAQRKELLNAERNANRQQPRNFKDDAFTTKMVHVEPNGTGPTPTDSFDAGADRKAESGNHRA